MRVRASAAQLPAVAVLAVVGVGLALAGRHHWRTGSGLLGVGVVLAAVLRAALPPSRAGWLVVRSRVTDVLLLLLCGLAIIVLSLTIPHP